TKRWSRTAAVPTARSPTKRSGSCIRPAFASDGSRTDYLNGERQVYLSSPGEKGGCEMAATLTRPAVDVRKLDPYSFLAVLGKRVIHPGGRRSTEELFSLAQLQPGQRALDVGCGVGTTAIQMARRYDV